MAATGRSASQVPDESMALRLPEVFVDDNSSWVEDGEKGSTPPGGKAQCESERFKQESTARI